MSLNTEEDVLILSLDNRIWIDSTSLVKYLRQIESNAKEGMVHAQTIDDEVMYSAASAVAAVIMELTDNIILTSITAGDKIQERRNNDIRR